MTIHTLSNTIALPFSLQLVAVLRTVMALGILTLLWPYDRFRPRFQTSTTSPYLLASFSLMVSYWALAGILLVALHLLNTFTVLAMAALPRLLGKRQIHSRYLLRWDVKFLVASLDTMAHPVLILQGLQARTEKLRRLSGKARGFWHLRSLLWTFTFGSALAVSLWLRLDTVFRNAAPVYQNALQNLDWINALAHNRWIVGGHPIPLGSFIVIAEIARVGFVNPLMLEKLAASLVFLGTLAGLVAVTWSMTRNVGSVLAAIVVMGIFPHWLPIPLVRELAVGPAALGMMATIPAFWLMYQGIQTGHRVYGIASLGLILASGVTNWDAGLLTAIAALMGWLAVWLSHRIPVGSGLSWLSTIVLTWGLSWIPMLLERLASHQWPLTTTMFPLPSTVLHAPQISSLEIGLLVGTLAWVAIRIWIEDYGAALGTLLLLVLALCLQEAPVLIPWHFVLSGTRQLLTLAESLAVSGIVALLVQDLITLPRVLGASLVYLAAVGLTMLTGIQPISTYTLRSDSYFFAYAVISRTHLPYSWLAVSNGGTSMVTGTGYHMDPLQWADHVIPKNTPLLYKGQHGSYRTISQHQIFFFVEHQIHATPLPNNQFTVLREQIRNHDLKVWLSQWLGDHPHAQSMTVFFQSPHMTVYRLSQGSSR